MQHPQNGFLWTVGLWQTIYCHLQPHVMSKCSVFACNNISNVFDFNRDLFVYLLFYLFLSCLSPSLYTTLFSFSCSPSLLHLHTSSCCRLAVLLWDYIHVRKDFLLFCLGYYSNNTTRRKVPSSVSKGMKGVWEPFLWVEASRAYQFHTEVIWKPLKEVKVHFVCPCN